MKIGDINIPNGIFLAPMAGVTDAPFRALCASFGAECVITEMVSAKAVCYGDKKTSSLASLEGDKRPAGIQLFGSEPYYMAAAAEKLMELKPDFFDINMGCPVKKIVSNGEGSALMSQPHKCGELVKAIKKAVCVPVTVKLRAGVDKNHITAVEVALRCEEAGAGAVTVHGRTRDMMYSGRADYDIIKRVKDAVSIPVIANGDIVSASSAEKAKKTTGCDGVMVGRGCLGRPWLFRELQNYFETGRAESFVPPKEEIWETVKIHIESRSRQGGDNLLTLRKQIAWYTKGFPGSAAARLRLNTAKTKNDFLLAAKEVFED
ncbi:MAG: tRNA dihydrouridine synthase DusB [Eubacteriales bacterium]